MLYIFFCALCCDFCRPNAIAAKPEARAVCVICFCILLVRYMLYIYIYISWSLIRQYTQREHHKSRVPRAHIPKTRPARRCQRARSKIARAVSLLVYLHFLWAKPQRFNLDKSAQRTRVSALLTIISRARLWLNGCITPQRVCFFLCMIPQI